MEKLVISLGLIIGSLTLGFAVQVLDRNAIISLPVPLGALRKLLQKIGLLFFMPISFMAAVWVVSFDNLRVVLLPVVCVVALISGGLLGLLSARLLKRPARQAAVLFCCGSFTNIGASGALCCYFFLGEAGFAMVALYKMLEETFYYTVGFPFARFIAGSSAKTQQSLVRRLAGVLTDPLVATVLSAFFVGLLLNLTDVPRPLFFEKVTAWFVPIGTCLLIVSIGLGMRFSSVVAYLPESLCISLVKFIAVPVIAALLAYLFGLHHVGDGLPFRVAVVLSSMPVAFNALIATSIYDLDLDLANSCWLVTTGALLLVMPWLYFLLSSGLLP